VIQAEVIEDWRLAAMASFPVCKAYKVDANVSGVSWIDDVLLVAILDIVEASVIAKSLDDQTGIPFVFSIEAIVEPMGADSGDILEGLKRFGNGSMTNSNEKLIGIDDCEPKCFGAQVWQHHIVGVTLDSLARKRCNIHDSRHLIREQNICLIIITAVVDEPEMLNTNKQMILNPFRDVLCFILHYCEN
jgi:hypothetical protein